MSKKLWMVTAGEVHFFSSLRNALQEMNYLHHTMADTFPRNLTDRETGFKEFLWELTDVDTQEDKNAADPWATDVWVSTGYWFNRADQDSRETIITIITVPMDTVHGVEKYDHAETDLLVAEDHL